MKDIDDEPVVVFEACILRVGVGELVPVRDALDEEL